MADVFISYKQEDRERVRGIAEGLIAAGFSVFWDREIKAGQRYRTVIEEALAGAKCVIVVWSEGSVVSDWVIDEADDGKKRGILIPVLIDRVEPPRGFRQLQVLDLSGWRGDRNDSAFRALLLATQDFVGQSETKVERVAVTRPGFTTVARLRGALWVRSLAFASAGALALFLYAGWEAASSLDELVTRFGVWFALAVALLFWARYAAFLSDRLRGTASFEILSASFFQTIFAALIFVTPHLSALFDRGAPSVPESWRLKFPWLPAYSDDHRSEGDFHLSPETWPFLVYGMVLIVFAHVLAEVSRTFMGERGPLLAMGLVAAYAVWSFLSYAAWQGFGALVVFTIFALPIVATAELLGAVGQSLLQWSKRTAWSSSRG